MKDIIEFLMNSLTKQGIPCAKVPGSSDIFTGVCVLNGIEDAYPFVVKVVNGYVALYAMAKYVDEVLKKEGYHKRILDANVKMLRGGFVLDDINKKLYFKNVWPTSAFDKEDDQQVKEFVVLGAAMVKRYKSELTK